VGPKTFVKRNRGCREQAYLSPTSNLIILPIFFTWIFAFNLFGSGPSTELEKGLNVLFSTPLYRGVDVGIRIEKIDGNEIIFERNPSKPMIPASLVKIFIAGTGLIRFGPGYSFETPVKTDGKIINGTLEGNIYLVGMGDPGLKGENLDRFAQELKNKGIHTISGDIVYDVSFLEAMTPRYTPNARHFYAPAGALTVNYNWIELKLDDGSPATLDMIPNTKYASLEYNIRFSRSEKPGRPEMICKPMPWGDSYTVGGTATDWDIKNKYLTLGVTRPGLYAATLLAEGLEKARVLFTGKPREGVTPGTAVSLGVISSEPLIESIRSLNRDSNNVVAELLTMDMAAYSGSVPGTRQKGLEIVENFCKSELAFKPGEFHWDDACGLSQGNRFTSMQITKALCYFYKRLGTLFVETLALQGSHPSVMNPVPEPGMRVYVKTGTLSSSGVNTVAGYIINERESEKEKKEILVFAILCNRRREGPLLYQGTLTNPVLSVILKCAAGGTDSRKQNDE